MTTTPLTDQQLAEQYERLANAAGHALHALGYLIEDNPDPGADALGAQYNLRQQLLTHTMRGEPREAVDAVAQHERRKAVAAAFARLDAREWGYDHGFCEEYGTDPETDAFVDAALAVVQPELDRLRAERDEFADRVDTLTSVAKSNKLAHRIAVEECDRLTAELEQARQQTAAVRAAAQPTADEPGCDCQTVVHPGHYPSCPTRTTQPTT